jgi:hypothetical protein
VLNPTYPVPSKRLTASDIRLIKLDKGNLVADGRIIGSFTTLN